MKIKYDSYHIGFLSKLFDVSTDTVRLYEKKGILSSEKDRESNYRLFRRDDVFNMDYARRLKEMQFSLDEIREILCSDTLPKTIERVEAKRIFLDEKIQELYEIKKKVVAYQELLCLAVKKGIEVHITEPIVVLMMEIGQSYKESFNQLKKLSEDASPALTLMSNREGLDFLNSAERMLDKTQRENCEILLTSILKEEISTEEWFLKKQIRILPKRKYLTALVRTEMGVDYQEVWELAEFAQKKGLCMEGAYFARYMISQSIHETPIDYYETWVPIAE